MTTHKSLLLTSRSSPPSLQLQPTTPIPTPTSGSAVVRILAADVVPYMREILSGARPYPLSLPLTPGNAAVGRVHAVGPDAVRLAPGNLVLCDITVRARDHPAATILLGVHNGAPGPAQRLMDGEWRHSTYAEYAKFPLENLYVLDEQALVDRLGYSIRELCVMPAFLVPMGGLSEVDVKPGESVVVAPATGRYGGAAVAVALALGARVVAAGRNETALRALEKIHGATGRLTTVRVTGTDAEEDGRLMREATGADGADVYLDLSPGGVTTSLLKSGVAALRPFGRCVVMGGMEGNVEVPYLQVMMKSLRIQGRFMYAREHVERLIKMVESGLLALGEKAGITSTKEFGLEQIDEALDEAAKLTGWGRHVVVKP